MDLAPLAILQARIHSERLPGKMLLDLGGHPLVWWGWTAAVTRFGREHVVVASPATDVAELQLALPEATCFGWAGPEWDVLGRLHACAHQYRTADAAIIVRVTPDDWPVDLARDAVTLAGLDDLEYSTGSPYLREHVGYLFHPRARREINTLADLLDVRRELEQSHQRPTRPAA